MYVVSPFGQPPKLKGKRVLVVEDEAPVSMLLEDELRDAGATVLGPAACVGDALRLVEAAAADGGISAAVLDINLEGERALPVAGRLAALSVPFVFATGYGEGCDTGEHGAAPTLRKPFAPERLVAAVEALAAQETGPAVRPGRGAGRLRRNAGRPARLPALFVARSRSEIAACSSARGARAPPMTAKRTPCEPARFAVPRQRPRLDAEKSQAVRRGPAADTVPDPARIGSVGGVAAKAADAAPAAGARGVYPCLPRSTPGPQQTTTAPAMLRPPVAVLARPPRLTATWPATLNSESDATTPV